MKYTVYLLRHGQTWFNKYNRMQGWSDTPLTPDGRHVAELAAQKLKDIPFAEAFSSDARRAVDTCKIITDANINKNKLNNYKITEFREQFYGSFEGTFSGEAWYNVLWPHGYKTFNSAVPAIGLDKCKDYMKEADPFHDAENAQEYWERIDRGFAKLTKVVHDGDNVLLVSHGTTIRSIAGRFGEGFHVEKSPANSSLTKVIVTDGKPIVTEYAKKLVK